MIKKRVFLPRIPGKAEWVGFEADLELRYAHRLFFGKSLAEVQSIFGQGRSIERASELLFMPRGAFQYYVLAFAQFVVSDAAIEDADSASPFLNLLVSREERDPGSVAEIYPQLVSSVEFVAANQSRFDADPNIYGSFPEQLEKLLALINGAAARKGSRPLR